MTTAPTHTLPVAEVEDWLDGTGDRATVVVNCPIEPRAAHVLFLVGQQDPDCVIDPPGPHLCFCQVAEGDPPNEWTLSDPGDVVSQLGITLPGQPEDDTARGGHPTRGDRAPGAGRGRGHSGGATRAPTPDPAAATGPPPNSPF